jgi:dUTP pyrophosphatase
MYILYLVPTSASQDAYLATAAAYMSKPYRERDAGFDLVSAAMQVGPIVNADNPPATLVSQQLVAACYDTERNLYRAFWMLPRSSLFKTPLRLANSVGLIDAGYRGDIKAAVSNLGSTVFEAPAMNRYFQLATPDLLPWDRIEVLTDGRSIPGGETLRGTGGFGSTGLSATDVASTACTASDILSMTGHCYFE